MDDRQYYRLELQASYPFYDKKTEKTIRNERVRQDGLIIDTIADYADTVAIISIAYDTLTIARLKQIRDKTLEKTGMKFLDDRIKTIEEIHKAQQQITQYTIKKERLKMKLLSLTTRPAELKKML